MTLSLTTMEKSARKATPWDSHDTNPATEEWKANITNNAIFCRTFSPDVALKLTRIARAARDFMEVKPVGMDNRRAAYVELEEALKEIEE